MLGSLANEVSGLMSVSQLLRPASVAVLGASPRPGSFGAGLLKAVRSRGYSGRVLPINGKYAEVDGLVCYPSLEELPVSPDCALIALGDHHVCDALEQVSEAGIKSAVIFSRCYGADAQGRMITDRLAAIGRAAGMAVCGGNCMGFINLLDGLQVTGMPFAQLGQAGHVGFVSHSGSTWSGMVANQRQIEFNIAVSAGQELITNAADYIRYLASLDSTRVIACVLETVRDPEGFLEALELADRRGIPVVVLKLGRSEAAKHFALSHSGAVSGSNAVYDALFARHNVIPVTSLDQLTDVVEMFRTDRRPPAEAIAIGTDSGGERQLIVDLASEIGTRFATLDESTNVKINQYLDPGMESSNPLDYWGDGDNVMQSCLTALAEDPNTGTVVMATNLTVGRQIAIDCADIVIATSQKTHKPVALMGNIATTMAPDEVARIRKAGVPVLMGTETALKALRSFGAYHFRRPIVHADLPQPVQELAETWRKRLAAYAGNIPSAVGFALLKDFGIVAAPWSLVDDVAAAGAFAAARGYPVVLKIDALDMPHKTEHGGVIVNIRDEAALASAFAALNGRHPGVQIMIQAMVRGEEFLLGMTRDPQFGPIVTFGLGGVRVEMFRDVFSLMPPFGTREVLEGLPRLRSHLLLTGFRGAPAANIDELAQLVTRFGILCLAMRDSIAEIEINPLMVEGDQMNAVDCLISVAK